MVRLLLRCANTMEAIRREIQNSQESVRPLVRMHGVMQEHATLVAEPRFYPRRADGSEEPAIHGSLACGGGFVRYLSPPQASVSG